MVNIYTLDRDGLRQTELCPRYITMYDEQHQEYLKSGSVEARDNNDRADLGHWGVGDKYATGLHMIKKIRGRENIAAGTCNVRTVRAGNLKTELSHSMETLWLDVNR